MLNHIVGIVPPSLIFETVWSRYLTYVLLAVEEFPFRLAALMSAEDMRLAGRLFTPDEAFMDCRRADCSCICMTGDRACVQS